MLNTIWNILKFLRHRTYYEFINKAWCAAISPLYENTTRCIVKLDLRNADAPDPNLNIQELTAADIDKMLAVMYLSRAGLQKRFSRGERCFAVLENDKILSYFWAQIGLKDLSELHLKFNLRPDQAWMYNAITIKSARGRGLYPNVIQYMAKSLIDSGINEAFVDVNPTNIASVRGLEKADYTHIALISMKKILSTISYKLTVFDKDTWQKLSETIEDFDQMQLDYVTEHNRCP